MAFLDSINVHNFNRYKLTRLVYTGWLNYLIDTLNAVFTSSTAMKIDTISEATAGVGVAIGFSTNVTRYVKDVSISSSDLRNMYATPKVVVAALGTEYAIDFVSAVLIYDDAGTDYANGGAITVNYSGGAACSTTLATTFLTGNGDKVWNMQKLNAANGYTMPVNTALVLTNASQAFTTGTGVCRLHIVYDVHKTGL